MTESEHAWDDTKSVDVEVIDVDNNTNNKDAPSDSNVWEKKDDVFDGDEKEEDSGDDIEDNSEKKNSGDPLQTAGKVLLCAGGAVAVACAVPIALGCGAGGIVGGSFMAAWQSSIGNVAAGSLFATLQSLGATGTLAAGAQVGAATAAAGGAALVTGNNQNNNKPKMEMKIITMTRI
mmetsp:Transcript_30122/g.50030  ORF Transcript_30122/g.50030 Transcript_30122/m.50030 type:complete len:177 (+) Transcript_30122:433-963(+)|eukprot:CAMPEP_0178749034 /NCGR_PEP_ID=MMETSP0744-20121128/9194_1 /TAXON_ID=913974 /ORGANISM="Nitzschia punctata, Strain CCMP561" /LENGTH=176 /DNA_ID=CAMNT_0020402419 /DNA_START=309 /DNA_END=839 /DNA_ORIENTATION=+